MARVGAIRSVRTLLGEREREAELAASTLARACPEPPALRLDEALTHGEADTDSLRRGRRARRAVEGREDALDVFLGDARAAIQHSNLYLGVGAAADDLDGVRRAAVLFGVADQIAQDLLDVVGRCRDEVVLALPAAEEDAIGGGAALAIDDTVSIYFAQNGVAAPSVLDPAERYEPFPERRGPRYDVPPGEISLAGGDSVFSTVYDHFGISPDFDSGRVVVQCLLRASGSFSDCQILEETPRNQGRGEVAVRIMASARATPATLNGDPVDGVPVRVPIVFRIE